MMRALDILNTPNFRKDLTLLEELINIKWSMNYATNYKKKGSLKSDLAEIRVWRKQWCETHKDKQRIRKKK
jgi:hypothetical protein